VAHYRQDRGTISKAERTTSGALRCDAAVTRSAVFVYRDSSGREVREWRPPEEVFKADSLVTLRDAPVTYQHPPGAVTPENVDKYGVGHISGDARQEGTHVSATVVVQARRALAKVEKGERELSCGYTCDIDPTPGVTPDTGERFDQVQRNIVYNHVAIVTRGRAGSSVALRLDSAGNQIPGDSEMTEQEIQALKDRVKTAEAKAESERARADAAEAERDKQRARADAAESPAAIEALVTERSAVVAKATAVMGKDWKADGKSNAAIRKEVAAKAFPDRRLDSESEIYVRGLFDAAPVPAAAAPSAGGLNTVLTPPGTTPEQPRNDAAEQIRAHQARLFAAGTTPLHTSKS
jgi:hypothetical protein